jgi:hypothetical protein
VHRWAAPLPAFLSLFLCVRQFYSRLESSPYLAVRLQLVHNFNWSKACFFASRGGV